MGLFDTLTEEDKALMGIGAVALAVVVGAVVLGQQPVPVLTVAQVYAFQTAFDAQYPPLNTMHLGGTPGVTLTLPDGGTTTLGNVFSVFAADWRAIINYPLSDAALGNLWNIGMTGTGIIWGAPFDGNSGANIVNHWLANLGQYGTLPDQGMLVIVANGTTFIPWSDVLAS